MRPITCLLAVILFLTGCMQYPPPDTGTYQIILHIGDDAAPGRHCGIYSTKGYRPGGIRGCASPGVTCIVTLSQSDWEHHVVHELAHCLNINHHVNPPRRAP